MQKKNNKFYQHLITYDFLLLKKKNITKYSYHVCRILQQNWVFLDLFKMTKELKQLVKITTRKQKKIQKKFRSGVISSPNSQSFFSLLTEILKKKNYSKYYKVNPKKMGNKKNLYFLDNNKLSVAKIKMYYTQKLYFIVNFSCYVNTHYSLYNNFNDISTYRKAIFFYFLINKKK